MFCQTLLSPLLLALVVAASPIVSPSSYTKLSLSRHLNLTGVYNVLRHDQARARRLLARANGQHHSTVIDVNEPVANQIVAYVASIGVGTPPTTYNLLIDTGSSNTWVGANKSYIETSSSHQTSNSVSVSYGSGFFSGTEYIDTVTLGDLVIKQQSIGVASTSSGFSDYDGILGIGPTNLTEGTLSPDSSTTIPTVVDNASAQGKISAETIGISFEPTTSRSVQNGEISWGGIDRSKFTGEINYVPLTNKQPASRFWGIDQSITYGSTSILSHAAGVVDTGTTLILLATNAFNSYKSVTGAVADSVTGFLEITPSQYSALKNLEFDINGVNYTLTPNAQIWPRSLNTAIGGNTNSIYLVVGDLRSIGNGIDFINGYTFLERFYSVYDTTNRRVGLATTSHTTATTN